MMFDAVHESFVGIPAHPSADSPQSERPVRVLPFLTQNGHRLDSIETMKRTEFVKLCPKRAEVVDRVAGVAVADSHPAKQHLLRWKIQQGAHDLVHANPNHLRTGIQSVAARQER